MADVIKTWFFGVTIIYYHVCVNTRIPRVPGNCFTRSNNMDHGKVRLLCVNVSYHSGLEQGFPYVPTYHRDAYVHARGHVAVETQLYALRSFLGVELSLKKAYLQQTLKTCSVRNV